MRKRLKRGTINRSRELRRNTTDAEGLLWWKLRELHQRVGLHFRRQVPFRGYILDFAEHSARLVIELDGYQHGTDEHRARDIERDEVLSREGYLVLRFSNADVFRDLAGVAEFVLSEAVKRRCPITM
ncbi:MAG: endonuclease domain-containing protein [Proteobacteria bacterium]|nr:endonuclease domain-containing protein [Pseudomonadota bacterium]